MGSAFVGAGTSGGGVIPRVMQAVFDRVAAAPRDIEFAVRVGFVEIHKVGVEPALIDRFGNMHCRPVAGVADGVRARLACMGLAEARTCVSAQRGWHTAAAGMPACLPACLPTGGGGWRLCPSWQEEILDLLVVGRGPRPAVHIREVAGGGVCLAGAAEREVRSRQEMEEVLEQGTLLRATGGAVVRRHAGRRCRLVVAAVSLG
jgi:hypothetical protein